MRKLLFAVLVLAVFGAVYFFWPGRESSGGRSRGTVEVLRDSIARHAVAVGRVEAEREVAVKSLTGGILTKLFVKLGDKVRKGDRIAEVRPVITDLDHIQAERSLVMARQGEETVREYAEGQNLAGIVMRLVQGKKNLDRMQQNAMRSRAQAEEQIRLLREGKVKIDDREVDFVVRAPANGHVVEVPVLEGAPVVASSSFGSGTVLVTLADLDKPVFRGTVDEIDVGRLRAGMVADVKIGALPDVKMNGRVVEIGLRAKQQNNAVVFDVRLDLDAVTDSSVVIRSGYSAIARIRIAEKKNVLVLPERVVTFRGGKAFVRIPDDGRERQIGTGLSDGLRIEVTSGLEAGTLVLER